MNKLAPHQQGAGKLVLIAGYSEGFGSALEKRFSNAGYKVVGVARRHPKRWQYDLSDATATLRLFKALDRLELPLAGVIHNSMEFLKKPILQTTAEEMQSVWRSMVLTAFNVTQHAIPRMRDEGGSLLFSGASGSLQAGAEFSAFSSAKFALRGFTQSLMREHAANGIHTVHIVLDGLIQSHQTERRFPHAKPEQMMNPFDLADEYFELFHQPRDLWKHEIQIGTMKKVDKRYISYE